MISRLTARLVAQSLGSALSSRGYRPHTHKVYFYNSGSKVYDFFYESEYPAYLCNSARESCSVSSTRPFIEFVMKLHTGESLIAATQNWTREEREKLGQSLLKTLAEDVLAHPDITQENALQCRRSLELDGFTFQGLKLLAPESDVLDSREEAGVLETLYGELNLANKETAVHHLKLSEKHYLEKRWDDAISNSRKFLEGVMQEIAASYSLRVKNSEVDNGTYSMPVRVRDYLEREGLLETKEKQLSLPCMVYLVTPEGIPTWHKMIKRVYFGIWP